MSERIVSPGVFTQENDLSFLPAGIEAIGACFIGPTIKGPAMIPTQINSYGEFIQTFGDTNPNLYLPYAAKEYLNNGGSATIIRTLHDDGYTVLNPIAIMASGSYGLRHIGLLHPSQVLSETSTFYDGSVSLFGKSIVTSNLSGSFVLHVSGAYTVDTATYPNALDSATARYSASIDSTSTSWLSDLFDKTPAGTSNPTYLYTMFSNIASASISEYPASSIILQSGSLTFASTYSEAETPWIISQTVSGLNQSLFKVHTISHGVHSNYELKIGISNIKPAGSIAGSEYGSFTLTVRGVDQSKLRTQGSPYSYIDSDLRPMILENFDNVNLDPNSPRFISRVIGDRYKTFESGKVVLHGDYPNLSKYIYIEADDNVKNAVYSPTLVPFGFAAIINPLPSTFGNIPSASFVTSQTVNGSYNKRVYFGFSYDFTYTDNINYLKPLPSSLQTSGENIKFLLSNCREHSSLGSNFINLTSNTSIDSRKFMVPFQGGADGIQPNRRVLSGTNILAANTQGYDLSSIDGLDYSVYKNAIDSVSNPDEIDINMLFLPGVIQTLHPAVIDYAANMCNDRADVFFVFDNTALTDSVSTATNAVSSFDDNYSATYYPWVKIMDTNINRPVWVPPGVVMPGVLAYNDRVAAEWFAPAGLNRGGLTQVLDAYTRLTTAERDLLHEGRINPLATFPKKGVVVWGQKTLQAKPSALDRINVRRMLIAVKKYIASTTKYLVFENNTAATRNRFLNIVNPYLESIQQRQGLYSFRVVMDETNNGPDVIDRNIMKGSLYLKPTKVAEFIIIDLNIMPQGGGASFAQ